MVHWSFCFRSGRLLLCMFNFIPYFLLGGNILHSPSSHISPEKRRRQWLFESETIINTEHSLLFCAPPNVGSLQFRMLAKRMEVCYHIAEHGLRTIKEKQTSINEPHTYTKKTGMLSNFANLNS